MNNIDQEALMKFEAEIQEFKKAHPDEYLELLKTLNKGIREIIETQKG
jgi:hypothetical protein